MRILLTGGGTGGHIYPALAIARELQRDARQLDLAYIGTEKGLEGEIVPKAGISFYSVEVQGFRRKLSWDNVRTLQLFWRAIKQAKSIMKAFRPDAVVGTGGYVSGPVIYAAHRLGIPSLIHEQNVLPGLTNKFLARYASVVAISFEGSERYFQKAKHLIHSGNPRASEVVGADAAKGRESVNVHDPLQPIVLIVGGSRGARPLNDATLQMVANISKQSQFHVVYVTGEIHYEAVCAQLNRSSVHNLTITRYLHNMPEVLAASSLAVSRAGASTLAEFTALGLPSVLIPSPYVTNNHQEANARWLEGQGAAKVLLESALSGDALWQMITHIMDNPVRQEAMAQAALALGQPQAAARIVAELDKLVNTK